MILYPRIPHYRPPFMPTIHADGTRTSGQYVVFEGSLFTVQPLSADGVAWLEVFAQEHPGQGWIARTRGEEPEGWGYYLKGVPSEDLVQGSVNISTDGSWNGLRMYVSGFDTDGNVRLFGPVPGTLYDRTLNGEEPGLISVGASGYWDIDVTVTREVVTDIAYTYSGLDRLRSY